MIACLKRLLQKLRLTSNLILFLVGGSIYYAIEFVYKNFISTSGSPTHWTMFVVGGICFLAVGLLNEYMSWDLSLIVQDLLGTAIITCIEFISGCILNLGMGLGIWDYSSMPLNLLGQICLPFCAIWLGLSLVAIFLDDYLRWKWFGEEKPHYHWI